MDATEKAKQQKIIMLIINGIYDKTNKFVEVKDLARKRAAFLSQEGSKTYTPEHVEAEIKKVNADLVENGKAAYESISKSLHEVLNLIKERDAVLDLSSPGLANAAALINAAGEKFTSEEAEKLNAGFAYDQASLHALQAIYHAKGVISNGGIDFMVYEADEVIEKLDRLCFESFVQNGSINYFAGAFAKFAALEGVILESSPDQVGLIEAIRKGAGL